MVSLYCRFAHCPLQQVFSEEHMVPQLPQYVSSDWRSAQEFPHRVVPAGQDLQLPLTQISSGAQTFPHPPHAYGNVCVFMHRPLHRSLPAGQVLQAPLKQSWLSRQAFPQAPQLAGSDRVSVQEKPPQSESVALQPPAVHVPLLHHWPAGHAFPQAPQLAGSRRVRAHEPPQHVSPQPALQNPRHAPQLNSSVCRSTQAPSHSV